MSGVTGRILFFGAGCTGILRLLLAPGTAGNCRGVSPRARGLQCREQPEQPLRMAKAAEIIRRAMARLGLAPERARIALCAPSQSAALEAAARELSKDVRYLALCAPNGERLARTLRWDCGASVHTLQTDERIAADLSVCFDDFPLPDGLVLPLGSGAVSVAYGTENLGDAAMIWNEDQLICALYASLARRADEIWVKDVKMPPDGGENANLP